MTPMENNGIMSKLLKGYSTNMGRGDTKTFSLANIANRVPFWVCIANDNTNGTIIRSYCINNGNLVKSYEVVANPSVDSSFSITYDNSTKLLSIQYLSSATLTANHGVLVYGMF